jgi:pimeloyl-ACP methyl ester carboxylesterase
MCRNILLLLITGVLLASCAPTGSIDPEPVAATDVAAQPAIGPGTVTSADGVEIAYTAHRIGDPNLVLVHGWMCDQSYWEEQVPVLAEAAFGVVTVDLAGHGESGSDRQAWTTASLGADVTAVIEKLQLDRVIVVGHSMGGRVALEVARLLPGRVIGIIGVDTLQNADAKVDPDQTEAFLAGFANDFATTCDGFVRSMFGATTDTLIIDKIAADMCAGPGPVGAALMRDYVAYETAAAMQAVGVPVRCVNADKWPTDAVANSKYCEFDVTIIPGAGHFLMQEAPDQLNTALIETVLGIINQDRPDTE